LERVPGLLLRVEARGACVELVDLGRAGALERERELVAVSRVQSRSSTTSSESSMKRTPLGRVASM
jgi:hypothetical protein